MSAHPYMLIHFRTPTMTIVRVYHGPSMTHLGDIGSETPDHAWAYLDRHFPGAHVLSTMTIGDREARASLGVGDWAYLDTDATMGAPVMGRSSMTPAALALAYA